MELKGIHGDIVIFRIFINSFCQLSQITLAFSVFSKILKLGYEPDVIILSRLIIDLHRKRQFKEACNFYDKVAFNIYQKFLAEEHGVYIIRESKLKVVIYKYNKIIDGLWKDGKISCILALIDEIHDRNERADGMTYTSLVVALCKEGYVDMAIGLVRKMREKGIVPDEHAYTSLMNGLWKVNRFNDAQEIFQDFLTKGYRVSVHTYTVMINDLCKRDLLDEALNLWSMMKDNGCMPHAETFKVMICALYEKNEIQKAKKFLQEMIIRGLYSMTS